MLEETLDKDFLQAMKAQDKMKSGTLSFLRSQLKYVRIEKKVEKLSDADVATVIQKQLKQRQDSIEQFTKGGRVDLADKEKQEVVILESYLPKGLSDDELKSLVTQAVKDTQATAVKDMGRVIKAVGEKAAGRADNKRISDFVKAALTQ